MSSYLEITAQSPDKIIYDTLQNVITNVIAKDWPQLPYEGEYPVTGFGIQEIRPVHFGLTSNYWATTVAAGVNALTWNDYFGTVNVSLDCYLIITGVYNLSPYPTVTAVKFTANGQELPIMHIELLNTLSEARMWLKKPIVLKPKSTIRIEWFSITAQQNKLGIMGFCLGKRAYLINKAATTG
jgi:hypothetical protein